MSKKTRQKAVQTIPEPVRVVTLSSSARAVWRRSGLLIAGGLFLFSNLALRLVDTKTIAPTAFGMIAVLTFSSVAIAVIWGVQYALTSSRATRETWSKTDWERWRNGLEKA